MGSNLSQRVARLEQQTTVEPKVRYVWWDARRGEPKPVAQPGEKLIIISWKTDDEADEPVQEDAGS